MLFFIPGALCLVEDSYVVVRQICVALATIPFLILDDVRLLALTNDVNAFEILATPKIDHLDELLDLRLDVSFGNGMSLLIASALIGILNGCKDGITCLFLPLIGILCQSLLQHGNQWVVSREVDRAVLLLLILILRGHRQTDERFACTWHTRDHAKILLVIVACLMNKAHDALCCTHEVLAFGITSLDVGNGMVVEEFTRSLYDVCCWAIRTAKPLDRVDDALSYCLLQYLLNERTETV